MGADSGAPIRARRDCGRHADAIVPPSSDSASSSYPSAAPQNADSGPVSPGIRSVAGSLVELMGSSFASVGDLVSLEGAREFLSGWHRTAAGSHRRLELILGLLDPEVRVELALATGRAFPARAPSGQVGLGVIRRERVLRARVIWSRLELVRRGPALRSAVSDLLHAWRPPTIDAVEFEMTWRADFPGIAGASRPIVEDAMNPKDLMEEYATTCLGMPRDPALPRRTVIAVQSKRPVSKPVGDVVLSDRALSRSLSNDEPLTVDWLRLGGRREEDWRVEYLRCLKEGVQRLALLISPTEAALEFRLAGSEIAPRRVPRWDGLLELECPTPLAEGEPVELEWRPSPSQDPEGIQIYLNPCRFVAARKENEDFPPDGEVPAPPRTFVNLVAGRGGLEEEAVIQPLPLLPPAPAERDDDYFRRVRLRLNGWLDATHDVEGFLSRLFSTELRDVRCERAVWYETPRAGGRREGLLVRVAPREGSGPSLRARVLAALRDRMPFGTLFRLEVGPAELGEPLASTATPSLNSAARIGRRVPLVASQRG